MDAPPPSPVVLPVGPARWNAPRIVAVRHPIAVRPGESFDVVASFAGDGDSRAVFDNDPVDLKLRATGERSQAPLADAAQAAVDLLARAP